MAPVTNTIQGKSPAGYDGKTLTPLTPGALGTSTNSATANLNAGSYIVPTTNTNVITSSSIQPITTPVPLASNNVDTSSYTSKINSVASDLANGVNVAQQNVDALNSKGKSESDAIANLQSLLGGKVADTNKIYNEKGVTDLYNQLSDLNAQATGLKNEATAIPIQIQNEFKGTGATDAGVAPITSSRLRDNALKALSLGQQASIASAQYDKAKNYADQIIDAKYSQIEADIKSKLTNLSALKDFELTPAQEKLRLAQEQKTKAEQAQLDVKKELEKNINSLLIEAQKNNASPDVINKIKNSTSFADAIANAGTSLSSPDNEIVKLGDNQAYLIDKKTGKVIKSFNAGSGTGSGGGTGGTVGIGPDGTITGISKNAQAYIDMFNNGTMSLEDIYSKIGASKAGLVLKNEIAQGIQAQGGQSSRVVDSLKSAKEIAQAMLDKKDYTQFGQSARALSWTESFGDMQGRMGQLSALLTRDNLGLLKGSMSDADREFIQSMSTGFRKDGGVVSEEYAKSRINSILNGLNSKLAKIPQQQQQSTASVSKGSMTDPQFVEKALVSKGVKYDDLINNVPYGQIPVIDNVTGDSGYIPYQEFDPKKYTKA